MSQLTADEIADIRARAAAATEGPWTVDRADDGMAGGFYDEPAVMGIHHGRWRNDTIVETDCGMYPPKPQDAEFIAHARADVPALCDALEAERKANDTLLAGRVLDVERLRRAEQDLRSVQRDFDDVVRERDALRARVHELEGQLYRSVSK